MPQFDPSTFASQLFWLAVTFVLLYIVVSRLAIPRLSAMLEQREKTIADDKERAEQLKAETEEAIATYEKALAEARANAHDILREAQDQISKAAEARNREVSEKLAEQIKAGEEKIAVARAEAMTQVKEIAAGAASAMSEKLVGMTVDDAAVNAAVNAVSQEGKR